MNQNLLQTVNQLITKYGDDPGYRVKSKTSPLQGYSVEDLKKERDGILAKRSITTQQLQEVRQRLVPSRRAKQTKEASPPSPLEKAVMSRRPVVDSESSDEAVFPVQDWETEGSGLSKMADRLEVSLGSIRAGNSSMKLRNQVRSMLDSLVGIVAINEKQKKKIIHSYIDQ